MVAGPEADERRPGDVGMLPLVIALLAIAMAVLLVVFAFGLPGLKPVAAATSLAPQSRDAGMKKPSDSATASLGGAADALTEKARALGFACSDRDAGPKLYERLCALKYDTSVTQLRFLGPTGGEVKRLMLSSGFGGFTKEQAATLAAEILPLVVADAKSRSLFAEQLTPWPTARGNSEAPWGAMIYGTDGIRLLASGWKEPTARPAALPLNETTLKQRLGGLGYTCKDESSGSFTCVRTEAGFEHNVQAFIEDPWPEVMSYLWFYTDPENSLDVDDVAAAKAFGDEAATIIGEVAGDAAPPVQAWLAENLPTAGVMSFVGGLEVDYSNDLDGNRQLRVFSPCWLDETNERWCITR